MSQPVAASSADGRHPRVSVVIPCWNSLRWLPGCLQALAHQTFLDFEILLVDSASTDGTGEWVRKEQPVVNLIELPANRGFAAAANAGAFRTSSVLIAFLNPDTEARPGWLESLVARMDASPPAVASIASKMLQLDAPETIDDAGDELNWFGMARKRGHGDDAELFSRVEEVLSPCAGAALYRRAAFEELGGFDETFGSYLEDVDLGLRARLSGFKCVYEPKAEVLHKGGGSGLARSSYVRLVTRNRLLLLGKNIPGSLLLRHIPRLLWGQIYFALVYRRPVASFRGWAGFVARLPRLLSDRRHSARGRRLSKLQVDRLLSRESYEPPLRRLLLDRLRGKETSRSG
jgi:GT2 family glycosyltransferase